MQTSKALFEKWILSTKIKLKSSLVMIEIQKIIQLLFMQIGEYVYILLLAQLSQQ